MDPTMMEAAFRQYMQENKKDHHLTNEEAEKFEKAFQDPEFCRMMSEYVDEISDPAHRKEQEEYLAQMEAEHMVPEGKELIRPKAGFVIKTHKVGDKDKDKEKIFINVVHSTAVDKPTPSKGSGGVNWSIPKCLGPVRMEKDKGGSNVPAFDMCFHPDALSFARKDGRFKDLVVQIAMESVMEGYKAYGQEVKLDKCYHVVRGVDYKSGEPVTMMISKPPAATPSSQPKPPAGQVASGEEATRTKSKAPPTASKASTSSTPCKAGPPPPCAEEGKVTADGLEVPHYTVTERGRVDISDHMAADVSRTKERPTSTRPKEVVIRIDLPSVKNASELDLDMSEKRLLLTCPGRYKLDLALPYEVLAEKGTARFDKSKKALTVTVPVVVAEVQCRADVDASDRLDTSKSPPAKGEDEGAPSPSRTTSTEAAASVGTEEASSGEPSPSPPTTAAAPSGSSKASTSTSRGVHERWVKKEEGERLIVKPDKAAIQAARTKAMAEAAAASARVQKEEVEEAVSFGDDVMFVAASTFLGRRAGFVFTTRDQGVGYYRDGASHGNKEAEVEPSTPPAAAVPCSSSPSTPTPTSQALPRPPFRFQQKEGSFTIIVDVAKIDSESVKFTWGGAKATAGPSSTTAQEVTIDFTASQQPYHLHLHLWAEVRADDHLHDVAGRNMLVVLTKATPGLWPSLEQGDQQATPTPTATQPVAPAAAGVAPLAPTLETFQFQNKLVFELD